MVSTRRRKSRKTSRSRRVQRGGSGEGKVGEACSWHPITGRDTCLPGITCGRGSKQCVNKSPPVLELEYAFFDNAKYKIDTFATYLEDQKKDWERIKKLVEKNKEYFTVPLYVNKLTFLMKYILNYYTGHIIVSNTISFFEDEASKLMLEYSDVDAADSYGDTALMYLIKYFMRYSGFDMTYEYIDRWDNYKLKDYSKILEMFLNKTTNINKRNKHGNTALHVLFYHGFLINKFTIIYVDAILKKGADVTLKNTEGNTPLDLAIMDVKNMRQLNEEDTIIWNKIKEVLTPKYGAIPVMYEEDTENEGL
jgi:hypothetical protein